MAQADRVARRLLKQTQPLLGVLDGVLAAGHPLREGAHDEVALRALACQIAYGNKTEDWGESKALLEATLPVAASESARGRIQENLTIVSANLEHQQLVGKCWFCKTRQPETSAAIEVKMHGDIKRLPIPGGVRVTWQHAAIKVPRCVQCARVHSKAATIGCVGALLGVLVGYGSCSGYQEAVRSVTGVQDVGGGHRFVAAVIGVVLFFTLVVLAEKAGKPPAGVKPQAHHKEFPRVKELLDQKWAMGEKPAGTT